MSDARLSGNEPLLGGLRSRLSGYEPLLGGKRREGADAARIQKIIDARDAIEHADALESILRFRQGALYARELANVIPARARHLAGGYRGSFTPAQRVNAIRALERIGGPESVLSLLETLDDSNYEVRGAAGKTLPAIVTGLAHGEDRTRLVYSALVEALGLLAPVGRSVVIDVISAGPADLLLGPLLNKGLASDEAIQRRESARALGMIGDKRATKRLIAALEDPNPAVRGVSAWALGRMPARAAIDALIGGLDDEDANARGAAAEALGAQALRLINEDEPVDRIVEVLGTTMLESDPVVSGEAKNALQMMRVPEARETLLASMRARR